MTQTSHWTPLHAKLHRTLRVRQLLPKHSRILIAVSGGQDSLCLAQLLLDLQPKWGWILGVAHCDHRWREDSTANANHVEQLAIAWELPFYQRTAAQLAKSEAAARQWRYHVLGDIAQQEGYDRLVTGHTQSDRAETFLYNLIRGAGADGLKSIPWNRTIVKRIELVRPLLEVSRAETERFCQQQQLKVWEDATNHDLKYARNRIRQELLPYLQTHFNPKTEAAIAKTAELLRADVEYLEQAAAQLLEQASPPQPNPGEVRENAPPPSLRLNRRVLQTAPLALQRRVMRQFLTAVLPSAPSFEQVEKIVATIAAPNKSRTDPFPGGAIAEVEGDWISLQPVREPLTPS